MSALLLTSAAVAGAVEEATDEIREQFRPPPNTLFLHAKQMEVFKHPSRFKVVVAGRRWGKCLHGDSMVEMADGTVRPIKDVQPGDVVQTVNEKLLTLEPRRVLAVESNGVKENVEVQTAFRFLRGTPHHPVLTSRGWVDAGQLAVGDLVAVPQSLALKKFDASGFDGRAHHGPVATLEAGLLALPCKAHENVSKGLFKPLAGHSKKTRIYAPGCEIAWEQVTSVKQANPAQTWDLSIEGNHNFIANGVVVHNTQLAKVSLIKFARKKGRLVWYVAPSYRMAKQIMWPALVESIPRAWVKKYNETTLAITLVNGTRIELKGADNPDSLRGVGIHYLVLDEYQDINPEAWVKVLRPTLASTGGHALFIGTPRAYNGLFKLWEMGQKGTSKAWASWQFPTITSPFIPVSEIAAARDDMDPKSFKQEFEACHLPETEVQLWCGKTVPICKVQKGYSVVHVLDTGERAPAYVMQVGTTGEKPIMDVTLETGEVISASVHHKFKVHNEARYQAAA